MAALLIGSLVNSGWWLVPTLAPYFLVSIFACALLLIAGIRVYKGGKNKSLFFSLPVLVFGVYVLYYAVQSIWITGTPIITNLLYLIALLLFLLAIQTLLRLHELSIVGIYQLITLLGLFEGFFCLFQLGGWLPSSSHFFAVTGTWQNPNVTAIFLALVIPAALSLALSKEIKYSLFWSLSLIPIIAGCILLKCRTAYIGAIAEVMLMLFLYGWNLVQAKLQRVAMLFVFIAALFMAGLYMYNTKSASADGRRLIWKISAQMIKTNPWSGIGIGRFEHDYNLWQANYFAAGQGSAQDTWLAGSVNMAYNDFVEQLVEGGIPALLLWEGFLIITLVIPLLAFKKFSTPAMVFHWAAFAGIGAFALMGLVNFSIQAIPGMCLLIIFVAVLTSETHMENAKTYYYRINNLLSIPRRYSRVIGIAFILVGLFAGVVMFHQSQAYHDAKEAVNLESDGQRKEAFEKLQSLETVMDQSPAFLMSYSEVLYKLGKIPKALAVLSSAKVIGSGMDIYMMTGDCYFRLKQYDSALANYTMAHYMIPNRLTPVHSMMMVYLRQHDNANALLTAKKIIAMQPKGTRMDKVKKYKIQANDLLTKMTIADSSANCEQY